MNAVLLPAIVVLRNRRFDNCSLVVVVTYANPFVLLCVLESKVREAPQEHDGALRALLGERKGGRHRDHRTVPAPVQDGTLQRPRARGVHQHGEATRGIDHPSVSCYLPIVACQVYQVLSKSVKLGSVRLERSPIGPFSAAIMRTF